jgi:hypothetical protein
MGGFSRRRDRRASLPEVREGAEKNSVSKRQDAKDAKQKDAEKKIRRRGGGSGEGSAEFGEQLRFVGRGLEGVDFERRQRRRVRLPAPPRAQHRYDCKIDIV